MATGKGIMFRRRKTEPRQPSPEAAAALARADADAEQQQALLHAEAPLRSRLAEIRAHNHLAAELYAVLSQRRGTDGDQ